VAVGHRGEVQRRSAEREVVWSRAKRIGRRTPRAQSDWCFSWIPGFATPGSRLGRCCIRASPFAFVVLALAGLELTLSVAFALALTFASTSRVDDRRSSWSELVSVKNREAEPLCNDTLLCSCGALSVCSDTEQAGKATPKRSASRTPIRSNSYGALSVCSDTEQAGKGTPKRSGATL
jgi:hypothetical protein